MAYVIQFTPGRMNSAQYDEAINALATAGAGAPQGRLYHACYGNADSLRVVDVWESMEQFERFGAVLMPILQKIGVDPGQPDINEAHNIIIG